jgi:predicted deacylase
MWRIPVEMISLFVEGTMNVLKHHGILAGPLGRTGKDVGVFIGNSALPILATQGGIVEHLVKLNEKIEAGQKVALQRNSFGEVVAEYTLKALSICSAVFLAAIALTCGVVRPRGNPTIRLSRSGSHKFVNNRPIWELR